MKLERRFIATEVRAETQDGKKVLTGYAAKYGKMSHNLGGFNEIIKPGAFDRALQEQQDVKMLVNHDPNLLVGRSGRNLELSSDTTGLKFRVELPNTQTANDLHENVRTGIMGQCSFGFITKGDRWMDARDGGFKDVQYEGVEDKQALVRELTDVDLRDVSVVTDPAYPQTEVKARSGMTSLEVRSMWPDGIPEEVAKHMATFTENRDAKTKTKAGQELKSSDFAYVGDPQDTSTWKLPIHDKAHAQNALARFNQTKGIPADKKAAVHAKIVAAAKKFGIDVSEENSGKLFAATSPAEARAILVGIGCQFRDDKLQDIGDKLPSVTDALDTVSADAIDLQDAVDDDDMEAYDEATEAIAKSGKALLALLENLLSDVDQENEEQDESDDADDMRMRMLKTALSM